MDRVILYDGICNLCNTSVTLLLKLDKNRLFHYSSLQGEFVKTLDIAENIDSIIYYEEGTLYFKSTAILKICQAMGGAWRIATIIYLIPEVVRDYLYDLIAKYRYTIFGKSTKCRVIRDDEKALFID